MSRQSPESIITGFQQAWNARDAHALAELFVEDGHFVNAPEGHSAIVLNLVDVRK